MKRFLTVFLAAAIVLFGLATGSAGNIQAQGGPDAQNPGAGHGVKSHHAVCPGPAPTGTARCFAHVRDDADALSSVPKPAVSGPAPEARGANPDALGNGGAYDPPCLWVAYVLATPGSCPISSTVTPPAGGTGETVAVVDAYDDPSAAQDLSNYRAWFDLPCMSQPFPAPNNGHACHPTGAPPSFSKLNQSGGTSPPVPNAGWAEEISLDVDMVSAICPNCNIVLVEANTNSFADLATAEDQAASQPKVVAISNSYGGPEWSAELNEDASYDHAGVAVTASAGDSGYGVEYPAASRYVTAVGGTMLSIPSNSTTRPTTGAETVWSGTGSGCSLYEPKPNWQHDSGCAMRTNNDVAAVADPNTGVWVQYSGNWYIFGGTSVASPIIASVYALGGSSPSGASSLYSHTGNLFDVTSGSNGSCGGTYLCTASTSYTYNGPTGNGTPDTAAAFTSAPPSADFSISATPASQTVSAGSDTTYTVTVTPENGFGDAVDLTVAGLPPSNVSGAFSPTSIPSPIPATGGSSTLTITAASAATAGTSTLTVKGTDASTGATHSTTVALIVTAPDFSISATPSSQTVNAGSNAAFKATVSALDTFNGMVNLTVSGVPSGAKGTFTPTSITGSGSSTLTVTTASSTPAGTYTLTITGTSVSGSSTLTHTVTVLLTVSGRHRFGGFGFVQSLAD